MRCDVFLQAAVESDSDDDEPIGKMKKPTITAEVLQEKIEEMAKKDTFETLSLRGIREALCTELGVEDLSEHKAAIKEIVTEILSS